MERALVLGSMSWNRIHLVRNSSGLTETFPTLSQFQSLEIKLSVDSLINSVFFRMESTWRYPFHELPPFPRLKLKTPICILSDDTIQAFALTHYKKSEQTSFLSSSGSLMWLYAPCSHKFSIIIILTFSLLIFISNAVMLT